MCPFFLFLEGVPLLEKRNVGIIAAQGGALPAGPVLRGAAAVGVCLELELDEAESDASMGRRWMGVLLPLTREGPGSSG